MTLIYIFQKFNRKTVDPVHPRHISMPVNYIHNNPTRGFSIGSSMDPHLSAVKGRLAEGNFMCSIVIYFIVWNKILILNQEQGKHEHKTNR